jgi:hypothetical protein
VDCGDRRKPASWPVGRDTTKKKNATDKIIELVTANLTQSLQYGSSLFNDIKIYNRHVQDHPGRTPKSQCHHAVNSQPPGYVNGAFSHEEKLPYRCIHFNYTHDQQQKMKLEFEQHELWL